MSPLGPGGGCYNRFPAAQGALSLLWVESHECVLLAGLLRVSVGEWCLGGRMHGGASVCGLGAFFKSKVAGNQQVLVVFRVQVHVGDVILFCEFCVCRVAAWELRL